MAIIKKIITWILVMVSILMLIFLYEISHGLSLDIRFFNNTIAIKFIAMMLIVGKVAYEAMKKALQPYAIRKGSILTIILICISYSLAKPILYVMHPLLAHASFITLLIIIFFSVQLMNTQHEK